MGQLAANLHIQNRSSRCPLRTDSGTATNIVLTIALFGTEVPNAQQNDPRHEDGGQFIQMRLCQVRPADSVTKMPKDFRTMPAAALAAANTSALVLPPM